MNAITTTAPAVIEAEIILDPATDDYETRATALREAWAVASTNESEASAALALALNNRGVARVLKARTAYMAGALGSKTDKPNCAGAMRVLDKSKGTIYPYWKTGEALAAAGMADRITVPTAEEIAIAADIFDPINTANNASKGNASKGKGAGAGAGADDDDDSDTLPPVKAPADAENVVMADVIAAVEELKRVTNLFTRSQGFPANVAENLTDVLSEIGATIESHRVDGGK